MSRISRGGLTALCLAAATALTWTSAPAVAQPPAPAVERPVRLIAEAEDFKPVSPRKGKGGWAVVPFRENYFSSTFAITFLSRMGCLGAPEQTDAKSPAIAEQAVEIPSDSSYFVMARFEQPYNWSVEFTVEVVQNGKTAYAKTYGKLEDPKIWAMNANKPAPMVRYAWGGTDNIVWQHFDPAPLKQGKATIRLIAGPQMDGSKPRLTAARRNVDAICLTNDVEGMAAQMKQRTYLPYDGWLTQDGDLFIRATNRGTVAASIPIVPSPMGQHSPYYVHIRDWPGATIFNEGITVTPTKYALTGPRSTSVKRALLAKELTTAEFSALVEARKDAEAAKAGDPKKRPTKVEMGLEPGKKSGWVAMGGMLDALHNSNWTLTSPVPLDLEFAKPDGKGGLKTIRTMSVSGTTRFEMPASLAPNPALVEGLTRVGTQSEIRTVDEALEWLVSEVKKWPAKGKVPERFLIYNIGGFGGTPGHPAGQELMRLLGDNTALSADKKRALAAHWRNPYPGDIDKQVTAFGGGNAKAGWDRLYIVSYGDEMHLPAAAITDEELAAYMSAHGAKFDGPIKAAKDRSDPLFYYTHLAGKEKGGEPYIAGTAHYAKQGVLTGANYSPHANYLVTELDYIRPFKIGALTMPWSEDYVWQIPEFSIQAMGYLTSAFRAGAKYHNNPIHMYVLPHSPGNVPSAFRRSFYTSVANGATMINYFCASPLATGGTENYIATDDLAMWRAVRATTYDAGVFEDYVMDGKVRPAKVGLLLSSVDDIMTNANNFALVMHNNERKAIYYSLRHQQIPVDFLSEDDVIDGLAKDYSVIYVTEQWLHSKAVKALKKFAENGGTVIAHVGGGFLDEFNRASTEAGELYGVKSQKLERDPNLLKYIQEEDKPFLAKQDLPVYVPMDTVKWNTGKRELTDMPVIVWKQTLTPADGKVTATYADGSAAVVEKQHGKGKAILLGFLPGQAYLKSGLPLRPPDRGGTEAAYTHFIPTEMKPELRAAITDDLFVAAVARPVTCSNTLVEVAMIDTEKPARRMAVPLINYAGAPIKDLTVTIAGLSEVKSVASVERGKLKPTFKDGSLVVTLPLDIADMLLIDR